MAFIDGARQEISSNNVFVVDDDEDIRISYDVLLTSVGFNVRTFASVETLIEAEILDLPGCLVLDVRLTGESGLTFQRTLVGSGIHPPIVFISGHADIPMAVRAIKSGAVEFLIKPVHPQDLIDAINAGLRIDHERRERFASLERIRHLYSKLTRREQDVMFLVVAGIGNKQIAHSLEIGEQTVKAHRGQVMRKMNVATLPDLVRVADEVKLMKQR